MSLGSVCGLKRDVLGFCGHLDDRVVGFSLMIVDDSVLTKLMCLGFLLMWPNMVHCQSKF